MTFDVLIWNAQRKNWRPIARAFVFRDAAEKYAALVAATGGHAQVKEVAVASRDVDERQLQLFQEKGAPDLERLESLPSGG